MEKFNQNRYISEWQKKNKRSIDLKLPLDIGAALDKICADKGISRTKYIETALLERFQRDGLNIEDFKK